MSYVILEGILTRKEEQREENAYPLWEITVRTGHY